MQIREACEATFGWGESVVWDERRERLYFVDCASSTLHWLDDGEGEVHGRRLSSMPTGVVPIEDGRLLIVLDGGLCAVDPDDGREELIAAFPSELDGRANDACADLAGNVITGKLNLGPAEGSAWQWSAANGWRLLDADISNTNGPAVADLDGRMTLLIGDTSADYYAYDYEPTTGVAGARRVYGSMRDVEGHPDGATVDDEGGYWCALVGGGALARFLATGLDRTVSLPVPNPTDVTFGGHDRDRLYVTAIDGPLLVIDEIGNRGRIEPRARLSG